MGSAARGSVVGSTHGGLVLLKPQGLRAASEGLKTPNQKACVEKALGASHLLSTYTVSIQLYAHTQRDTCIERISVG